MVVFDGRLGRGVGVAIDAAVGAGVVAADVFANDAAAGLALAFVFGGAEKPHLHGCVIGRKMGNQF